MQLSKKPSFFYIEPSGFLMVGVNDIVTNNNGVYFFKGSNGKITHNFTSYTSYLRHGTMIPFEQLPDDYKKYISDKFSETRIFNPIKHGKYSKYFHERILSAKKFDPKSFRTIPTGEHGTKRIIGCLMGDYKKGKCSTGMKTQSILTPNPIEQYSIQVYSPRHKKWIIYPFKTMQEVEAKILKFIERFGENRIRVVEGYKHIIISNGKKVSEYIKNPVVSSETVKNIELSDDTIMEKVYSNPVKRKLTRIKVTYAGKTKAYHLPKEQLRSAYKDLVKYYGKENVILDQKTLNPVKGTSEPVEKGIKFDLPIDENGSIPLSLIGWLDEFKFITVKNGKKKPILIKDKKLSIWENNDKNVLIIMKAKIKKEISSTNKKAVSNYKEFNWHNPKSIVNGYIKLSSGDKIVYCGTGMYINYISDKFDYKERIHTHPFVSPHIIATNKDASIYFIFPVRINERGILS